MNFLPLSLYFPHSLRDWRRTDDCIEIYQNNRKNSLPLLFFCLFNWLYSQKEQIISVNELNVSSNLELILTAILFDVPSTDRR